jgi:hypothetical protein
LPVPVDCSPPAWPAHPRSHTPPAPPAPAGKWARGGWAGSDEQEKQIKEETQATLRCFPFDQPQGPHMCFMTGQPAAEVAIFAKSY